MEGQEALPKASGDGMGGSGGGGVAGLPQDTLPHPPPASLAVQKPSRVSSMGQAAKPQTHRKPGFSPPVTGISSANSNPAHSARQRTRKRWWRLVRLSGSLEASLLPPGPKAAAIPRAAIYQSPMPESDLGTPISVHPQTSGSNS